MGLTHDVGLHTIAATHELYARGWTKRQLGTAIAAGTLVRVRQGWYCLPDLPAAQQRAVRVGGRLTCVSAVRMLGLSARATDRVHVSVAPGASRLRSPGDARRRNTAGAVIHWADKGGADRVTVDALDSLIDMSHCRPLEETIAAVDSALRMGIIAHADWAAALERMPRHLGTLLSRVEPRAESITESFVRVRLVALGFEPRVQVKIAGVGRVDLLLGERLVIEVDGFAYHSDPDDFENDRRRDARLSARGFRVLRFSYRQVMGRWSEVKASIPAAVARGDHLP